MQQKPYMNVAEPYPLYDTVIVCSQLYGKEQSINGWFTSFRDFAADTRHTFFKSRTAGNSHLAYCNLDSSDSIDFVYQAFSLGVRFFGPVMPDADNIVVESPNAIRENEHVFWMFDLAKHCGIDFRVQQDVIVENTCIACPPGYGPRGGGGAHPIPDTNAPHPNQDSWKVVTGSNGEPVIDARFPFPNPIKIPRNASIEANIYLTSYARYVLENLDSPANNVYLTENQALQPADDADYFEVPTRYGVQVSLFGFREVQQRGQYHAPGAAE